jgi:hypothetical protein
LIPLRISCAAAEPEPCSGVLRVESSRRVRHRPRTRPRILNLGRAAFSVQPGQARTINVRVSRRSASVARRLRRVRITATAVARDTAGNESVRSRSGTLVSAKTRR